MPPAVNNILMGMLYDKTMTTPEDIWSKISTSELIPAELKRAAFDEFLKLRSNSIYGAQQAQAPTPAQQQKSLVDQAIDYMTNAPDGQKIQALNNFALVKKMTPQDKKTAYDTYMLSNYKFNSKAKP